MQWQNALQNIAELQASKFINYLSKEIPLKRFVTRQCSLQIDVTDPVSKVNGVAEQSKTLIVAINDLTTLVTSLEKDLKLGQASFSDAMEWILTEASKTDSLIVKSSPDIKKARYEIMLP